MNRKYLLLILLLFFVFITKDVYAIDSYDSSSGSEYQTVQDNDTYLTDNDDEIYYYVNKETNYTATIDDAANLLSEEEKKKLFDEMTSLTDYGHVAFVSTDDNSFSVEGFADNYYHSHFNKQSGSIFIIDMSNRKIYIFSDGNNYRYITNSKAYSITDNVYKYATNGDYYSCASTAFNQIKIVLDGGKIAEPMRYTSNVFIALTLSLFISFMYILFKSKMKKATYDEIVANCDVNFKINNTFAKKTGSRKVYSPKTTNSGGFSSSSGGGSFGGGGSSGGGGGHSF